MYQLFPLCGHTLLLEVKIRRIRFGRHSCAIQRYARRSPVQVDVVDVVVVQHETVEVPEGEGSLTVRTDTRSLDILTS